jgi:hypothetical protein
VRACRGEVSAIDRSPDRPLTDARPRTSRGCSGAVCWPVALADGCVSSPRYPFQPRVFASCVPQPPRTIRLVSRWAAQAATRSDLRGRKSGIGGPCETSTPTDQPRKGKPSGPASPSSVLNQQAGIWPGQALKALARSASLAAGRTSTARTAFQVLMRRAADHRDRTQIPALPSRLPRRH